VDAMTKVEGTSGPRVQHGDTSIQSTDQRMQQILLGPGTEKEKVVKLENELKTLMEAKPKTENDKKDLEAEKRQIQNQLKDPKSAFGKLSSASRHKLEEYFSKDGSVDSSRKQTDSKALKDGAYDRQRNRGIEERKLQENFMKFTPQTYEQKIEALKKEIEFAKSEIERVRGRGNLEPPNEVLTPWGRTSTRDSTNPDHLDKMGKLLREKTQELAKVEAEYKQKFPLRPKPNMLQE
jgi:hypothetical protein